MQGHGFCAGHLGNNMASSRLAALLRYSQARMAPTLSFSFSSQTYSSPSVASSTSTALAAARQARHAHTASRRQYDFHDDWAPSERQHCQQTDHERSERPYNGSGSFQGGRGRAASSPWAGRGGRGGGRRGSGDGGRGGGSGGGGRSGGGRQGSYSAGRGRVQDAAGGSQSRFRVQHDSAPRQQQPYQRASHDRTTLRPVPPPSAADVAALRSPSENTAAAAQLNTVRFALMDFPKQADAPDCGPMAHQLLCPQHRVCKDRFCGQAADIAGLPPPAQQHADLLPTNAALQAVPRNLGVQDGPWSPLDEKLVASATENTLAPPKAHKARFSEHGAQAEDSCMCRKMRRKMRMSCSGNALSIHETSINSCHASMQCRHCVAGGDSGRADGAGGP